jgi:hypothetical protein
MADIEPHWDHPSELSVWVECGAAARIKAEHPRVWHAQIGRRGGSVGVDVPPTPIDTYSNKAAFCAARAAAA